MVSSGGLSQTDVSMFQFLKEAEKRLSRACSPRDWSSCCSKSLLNTACTNSCPDVNGCLCTVTCLETTA